MKVTRNKKLTEEFIDSPSNSFFFPCNHDHKKLTHDLDYKGLGFKFLSRTSRCGVLIKMDSCDNSGQIPESFFGKLGQILNFKSENKSK